MGDVEDILHHLAGRRCMWVPYAPVVRRRTYTCTGVASQIRRRSCRRTPETGVYFTQPPRRNPILRVLVRGAACRTKQTNALSKRPRTSLKGHVPSSIVGWKCSVQQFRVIPGVRRVNPGNFHKFHVFEWNSIKIPSPHMKFYKKCQVLLHKKNHNCSWQLPHPC